jgi:hypothetical protein
MGRSRPMAAPGRQVPFHVQFCRHQALVVAKALDFDGTVNVTLGLPVPRTSPDHGVAYALAKGLAGAEPVSAALLEATELAWPGLGSPRHGPGPRCRQGAGREGPGERRAGERRTARGDRPGMAVGRRSGGKSAFGLIGDADEDEFEFDTTGGEDDRARRQIALRACPHIETRGFLRPGYLDIKVPILRRLLFPEAHVADRDSNSGSPARPADANRCPRLSAVCGGDASRHVVGLLSSRATGGTNQDPRGVRRGLLPMRFRHDKHCQDSCGDDRGSHGHLRPRDPRAEAAVMPGGTYVRRTSHAVSSVISAISGVENSRIGGPQKPVPRWA